MNKDQEPKKCTTCQHHHYRNDGCKLYGKELCSKCAELFGFWIVENRDKAEGKA